MSKAHDETSREPISADSPTTPVPVRVPADEDSQSSKRRDGTQRSRAGIPRERSGPIGIASGDFSTPSVRKRTTTQPRGTPISGIPSPTPPPTISVGTPTPSPSMPSPAPSTLTPAPSTVAPPAPVAAAAAAPPASAAPRTPPPLPPPLPEPEPVALDADEPPTPPPLPRSEPLGATPVDLVDGTSGQAPIPAPLATDSPFGSGVAGSDLDTEAAVLAAEAAAVRALDSGPLTPPPEAIVPGPTPLPVVVVSEDSLPTPPPVTASATRIPTPPPLPPEALEPPPEVQVAAAAPAIDQPVDEPVQERLPEPVIEGALPESPMASEGSSASSDLAHSVVETPAPQAPPALADADEDGAEAVEVEETSEADLPGDPAVARPPGTRAPTPPPIPGAFSKATGPEVRAPSPPQAVASGAAPVLAGLPILPEALSQRPRRPKRSKPWFEEVFDEDYLRTLPFLRADQTLREVEFISSTLNCPAGTELLDVGCGYGRHAIELVQRGFNVTGLDLSLPLLIRAADEAQRRALSVNFVHADMREMAFENQFEGAYSMLTSFGYFDEESNLRVAERIARALKPGGRFLLDIVNRDYVVGDLPVRVWWEGTGCVVLEEVDFNFHTSRINTHRSIVFEDGRQLEQELSIRAYGLHEIGRLLKQAGFRVVDVSGHLATRGDFFGGASRNLLVLAEKPADGEA